MIMFGVSGMGQAARRRIAHGELTTEADHGTGGGGGADAEAAPRRDPDQAARLVRPHRWRRIESGQTKSITDLAEQEGVTDAYVCRLLPLTCLAPDIVEAILEGRQPKGLRLAEVLGNGPLASEEQWSVWNSCGPAKAYGRVAGWAPK
jgi:hypothetical protein